MALLEIRGLVKRFGGLLATDHVDFSIEMGSAHSLIGPNGAGKSTLLNQIMGSLTPDEGSIEFDGKSILGIPPHEINHLGISRVFQSPEIFPELSLVDNVTIAALAHRDGTFAFNIFQHPRRRREVVQAAEAALEEVHLIEQRDTEARNLSRGDKRHLELAVCLAHEPRLLLLDEPTAGMSQHETVATIELLERLSEKGMTKLVIEHDMKVVFALSDRITVLHQGAVIASGTPDEVREDQGVQEAYLGGVDAVS